MFNFFTFTNKMQNSSTTNKQQTIKTNNNNNKKSTQISTKTGANLAQHKNKKQINGKLTISFGFNNDKGKFAFVALLLIGLLICVSSIVLLTILPKLVANQVSKVSLLRVSS